MAIKKRFFVLALASLLVLSIAPIGRTDTARPMIVRVQVDSSAEAATLMSSFDETHNHAEGVIELLLWPGDLARLDALGFEYEVTIPDLFARDQALAAGEAPVQTLPGPDRSTYRTLAEYNAEMQKLAKKNPDLVKLFEMKRPSLEGRTIYGVEIATNVKDVATDGRPIFYLDAVHHAREWPAAEYTMLYAYHLVENFGKDKEVTNLLRKSRVIIIPVINVDGFDYSRTSPAQNSNLSAGNGFEGYWRKNRRSLSGLTVPGAQKNPDAYGVDPNRNYAYLWGDQEGGSGDLPVDQTYRGEKPFSEPETRNVRDLILGRNVTGVITNHTYQATVLRTGGGNAPEDDILEPIGGRMADVLGYENNGSVGYPTTGTTDDWAYAAMGALGYTIENGSIGFHPPYDQEVGQFTDEHMEAYEIMHGVVANPKYHSVLKGKITGGSAQLTITKTFKTPLSPGNPINKEAVTEKLKMTLKTEKDGSFEWHVSPSLRPYEKKLESYTLTITSGGKTRSMQVLVKRGQTLDLGNIKL